MDTEETKSPFSQRNEKGLREKIQVLKLRPHLPRRLPADKVEQELAHLSEQMIGPVAVASQGLSLTTLDKD